MKKLVLFLLLVGLVGPSLAGAQGVGPSPAPAASSASADVDAAQMLARSLGPSVRVEFVKTNWPTMTADLLAGKFDLSMGAVSRSTDRLAAGLLSHTL